MPDSAETINVFLDTEIFDHHKYNFDRGNLARIAFLAKTEEIRFFLTCVTEREIIAHIKKSVLEACSAIKKSSKDTVILQNISETIFEKAMDKTFKDELLEKAEDQFQNIKAELKISTLPAVNVDLASILDNYFESAPPFGEGKKKSEFPDAFALAALEQWCIQNDQKMYIVSGDGDWEKACKDKPQLIYLKQLAAILEIFQDKELVANIKIGFEKLRTEVVNKVISIFEDYKFHVDLYRAEVDEIYGISPFFFDPYIVDSQDGVASVTLECEIAYDASIYIYQPSTGLWDYEHGELVTSNRRKEKLIVFEYRTIEIEIEYDEDDPSNVSLIRHINIIGDNKVVIEYDKARSIHY